jgi:UDP-N-acetylmuramoylalanine--D-glutamate ligase
MSLALTQFKGLPHRCEHVADHNGVAFINDSKATNVGSTLAAIEGIGESGRLIVLLGGVGKGQSFEALLEPVNRRAKAVIVFGAAADELVGLGFEPPLIRVDDLRQALASARSQAAPGDTVLLSPACASFDQFQNYMDRGETFRTLVLEGGATL